MKIHGVKSSQEKDDFDELYGDIDSSDITFYEVDINNFDFSDKSLDSLLQSGGESLYSILQSKGAVSKVEKLHEKVFVNLDTLLKEEKWDDAILIEEKLHEMYNVFNIIEIDKSSEEENNDDDDISEAWNDHGSEQDGIDFEPAFFA